MRPNLTTILIVLLIVLVICVLITGFDINVTRQ